VHGFDLGLPSAQRMKAPNHIGRYGASDDES
jgi:hypothetical protein